MGRCSLDSGKKEHAIDYARQPYQPYRPTRVGAAMSLIKAEFAAIGALYHGVWRELKNFRFPSCKPFGDVLQYAPFPHVGEIDKDKDKETDRV